MLSIEKLNSSSDSNSANQQQQQQSTSNTSQNSYLNDYHPSSTVAFHLNANNSNTDRAAAAAAELSALFDDEGQEEEDQEKNQEADEEEILDRNQHQHQQQKLTSDEEFLSKSDISSHQQQQLLEQEQEVRRKNSLSYQQKKSIHFESTSNNVHHSKTSNNSVSFEHQQHHLEQEVKNGSFKSTGHVEPVNNNEQHLSRPGDQASSLSRKSSASRSSQKATKLAKQDLPNIVDISSLAVTNSANINEISLERLNFSLSTQFNPKPAGPSQHQLQQQQQQQLSQAIMQELINNNQQQQQQNQQQQQQLNYLMRRERSLDRAPAIDNYVDTVNLGPATLRRSYNFNNQQQQSSPQHNQLHLGQNQQTNFSNSSIFLNSLTNQMSTSMLAGTSTTKPTTHVSRTHHRSNSILNASSATNSALNNMLNAAAGNGGGGGLRNSGRALSSNSFSTQNIFMQREPSSSSIKSLNPNNTNANFLSMQLSQSSNDPVNASSNPNAQCVGGSQGSSSKINFIKDLQIRLMDVQKECYYLRCELDTCQQKLSSSMQSIKQFWSPELKRERQMRKEETAKYALLVEQYKLLQNQYQTLLESYEQQTLSTQQLQLQLQQVQQQHQQDDIMMQSQSSPTNKHL